MHILDTIVQYKKEVVAQRKLDHSYKDLEKKPAFNKTPSSLKSSVLSKREGGVIAEFKKKSPSKKDINLTAELTPIVTAYEKGGAAGISVLTDMHFFGGADSDLIAATHAVELPILRKDFIIDEYQLVEAKSLGAASILLIARILSASQMTAFTTLAHNLGMEVLVEVHNQSELDKCPVDLDLIGINNRNLDTFAVDYQNSIALKNQLPDSLCKISESGIVSTDIMLELRHAGFDGFLIGERFMRTETPGTACQDFLVEYKEKLAALL